jgi:sarcosine oxidase subunit beta
MPDHPTIASADIIIIGAGIMGASIAFQLSRQTDKQIIVVDARQPVGGMSGRTFGQIRQHYSNELMVELSICGFDTLKNWGAKVGYGDPGYVRMGYMLLVAANQIEGLRRNVKLGQRLGVDTRFIEPDEIKHIEPGLTVDGLTGGCYEPNGGYIDVTRMVLSWLGAAQAGAVRVMTPLLVRAIETYSGRVSGVVTDSGFIQAPIVVNATGAWGRALLSDLGLEVPMEGHRLDMSYIDTRPQGSAISGCVTDGVSNVVMRPHWGHSMLVAAYPPTPVLIDDPVIEVSDQEYQSHHQRISRAFQERIPQLKDFSVLSNVSGAYDVTPDFHPILGWAPGIEGLCLAMGFSGHGLKLSPAIGEVISAMVLEQPSPIDAHALRYERFAQNDLMYLAYGPSARA